MSWRAVCLLTALTLVGCAEERRTQAVPSVPSCALPICGECDCDVSFACDPDCGHCDPECGRCRVEGATCREPRDAGPSTTGDGPIDPPLPNDAGPGADGGPRPDAGPCAEPASQPLSAPCCLGLGVDACGAGLFCAAFDGRLQPTCYAEGSRPLNAACSGERQCVVDTYCDVGPGGVEGVCVPTRTRPAGGQCRHDVECTSGRCIGDRCAPTEGDNCDPSAPCVPAFGVATFCDRWTDRCVEARRDFCDLETQVPCGASEACDVTAIQFPDRPETECRPAGSRGHGQVCDVPRDCARGHGCLQLREGEPPVCMQHCNTWVSCARGTCNCLPFGGGCIIGVCSL